MFSRLVASLTLIALVFSAGCGSHQQAGTLTVPRKEKLTIGGTGANIPLLGKLADVYMEKHKDVAIEIPASLDTEDTIRNTLEGNLDIGLDSLPINKTQGEAGLQQTLYAKTIVVFAVNPSTPISGLSSQQVRGIFSGRITNWSSVGGPDRKIVVLIGERGQATRVVVDKYIKGFSNLGIPPEAVILKNFLAMNEGITSIRDSIGWTDMGAIKADDQKIKPLSLDGRLPTVENYQNGKYPLIKNLYLLTKGEPQGAAKEFVDFALGWEGKKVILDNGYLVADK